MSPALEQGVYVHHAAWLVPCMISMRLTKAKQPAHLCGEDAPRELLSDGPGHGLDAQLELVFLNHMRTTDIETSRVTHQHCNLACTVSLGKSLALSKRRPSAPYSGPSHISHASRIMSTTSLFQKANARPCRDAHSGLCSSKTFCEPTGCRGTPVGDPC